MNAISPILPPLNEPVYSYAPGSAERTALKKAIADARNTVLDIPMYIGGKETRTGKTFDIFPPHDTKHKIATYHKGNKEHVQLAIDAALKAKPTWENTPWEQRAAIFMKAAELISTKYRYKLNAATMLGQSKNAFQAEIDSACEIIDFLRFNTHYMREIYNEQPVSSKGVWNRLEYRALEGFVFALTPFNFTAIAGNLPTAPAMCGNVVVWKPAETQIYSANVLMEIFSEAGVPDGVINLVYASGTDMGDVIFKNKDFAGIHFTGSTGVFQNIWKDIGNNIQNYKSYPRIVGETGGKDFIMVHPSANKNVVMTAIIRGGYEYQGQKCSAASRIYVPQTLWNEMKDELCSKINNLKTGPTEDFSNFVNAVINKASFDKIAKYIDDAKQDKDVEIIAGGSYDDSNGYFIKPTLILSQNPYSTTMCEEIFGPVVTLYIYNDNDFEKTLELVDNTSEYALTGSIISQDRYAIDLATEKLRHSAGNFYINDKPSGAVVGQQPFGGSRASGTNDKAGAKVNLMRWMSMRTIKETFVPPVDYMYPNFTEE